MRFGDKFIDLKLSTIGNRTFKVAPAQTWNALLEDVTASPKRENRIFHFQIIELCGELAKLFRSTISSGKVICLNI